MHVVHVLPAATAITFGSSMDAKRQISQCWRTPIKRSEAWVFPRPRESVSKLYPVYGQTAPFREAKCAGSEPPRDCMLEERKSR